MTKEAGSQPLSCIRCDIVREKNFDWEKHFETASFAEVRKLSPELSNRRLPSSLSPDRTLFYFSSQDDYGEVNDKDYLLMMLKAIAESFHRRAENEWLKKSVLYNDFLVACSMLSNLEGEDSPYGLPDELLAKMS